MDSGSKDREINLDWEWELACSAWREMFYDDDLVGIVDEGIADFLGVTACEYLDSMSGTKPVPSRILCWRDKVTMYNYRKAMRKYERGLFEFSIEEAMTLRKLVAKGIEAFIRWSHEEKNDELQ